MGSVIVITGTTCSGKTAIAEEIARRTRSSIISADSQTFRKGQIIGNGMYTMSRDIHYHLVGIIGKMERFTVSDFVKTASVICVRDIDDGKKVIIYGGSILHIEMFLKGIDSHVGPNPEIREWATDIIREHGRTAIIDLINELGGPKSFSEGYDERRLVRALEKAIYGDEGSEPAIGPLEQKADVLFIDRDDGDLEQRIVNRTQEMICKGWPKEVDYLLRQRMADGPNFTDVIGNEHIMRTLEGTIDISEAKRRIINDNLALVRSQRRWAKRISPIRIMALHGEDIPTLADRVMEEMDPPHNA